MWSAIKYSFSSGISTIKHLVDANNLIGASIHIDKVLHIDKLYQKTSSQYVQLLHLQSILQFNLRKYQDCEISLLNLILQLDPTKDKDLMDYHKSFMYYQFIIKLYYSLMAFTNPEDIAQQISMELYKQYYPDDQKLQGTIISQLALGNLLESADDYKESIELLNQSTQLNPELGFQNTINIAVMQYLSQNNNKVSKPLMQAFNIVNDKNVSHIDQIQQYYAYCDVDELSDEDIKLLLLLAQYMLKLRQVKNCLQYLNLAYKKVNKDITLQQYLPQIKLLYAIYFYDTKQKDSCRQLCESIQEYDTQMIFDELKIQAIQLEQKCEVTYQGTHREIKKSKDYDKIIDRLRNKLNSPTQAHLYMQFYTPLMDMFDLEEFEFDEMEFFDQ